MEESSSDLNINSNTLRSESKLDNTENHVSQTQNLISQTQNFVSQTQNLISQTHNHVPDIDCMIKDLLSSLDVTSQSLENEVQIESSKLLNILHHIQRILSSSKFQKNKKIQNEVEILISSLVLAFDALKENRNPTLAKHIRLNTERVIRRLESPFFGNVLNKFESFLNASSTGLKILIGLVLALPLYIAIPSTMIFLLDEASSSLEKIDLISDNLEARKTDVPEIYVQDFREGTYLMILSFIAGSTGSIISILSRVSEYSTPQYEYKYYNCRIKKL